MRPARTEEREVCDGAPRAAVLGPAWCAGVGISRLPRRGRTRTGRRGPPPAGSLRRGEGETFDRRLLLRRPSRRAERLLPPKVNARHRDGGRTVDHGKVSCLPLGLIAGATYSLSRSRDGTHLPCRGTFIPRYPVRCLDLDEIRPPVPQTCTGGPSLLATRSRTGTFARSGSPCHTPCAAGLWVCVSLPRPLGPGP